MCDVILLCDVNNGSFFHLSLLLKGLIGLFLFPPPLILHVLQLLGHFLLEVDALLRHQLLVSKVPVHRALLGLLALSGWSFGLTFAEFSSCKKESVLNLIFESEEQSD